MKESIGSLLGLDKRMKGDLESFREFIESRGETGACRGEVENQALEKGDGLAAEGWRARLTVFVVISLLFLAGNLTT